MQTLQSELEKILAAVIEQAFKCADRKAVFSVCKKAAKLARTRLAVARRERGLTLSECGDVLDYTRFNAKLVEIATDAWIVICGDLRAAWYGACGLSGVHEYLNGDKKVFAETPFGKVIITREADNTFSAEMDGEGDEAGALAYCIESYREKTIAFETRGF